MTSLYTPRRCTIIPLASHEAIVAALKLCAVLDDDRIAVVMVRGHGDDDATWTAIDLDDYDDDALVDEDWFAGYEDPQLWVFSSACDARLRNEGEG